MDEDKVKQLNANFEKVIDEAKNIIEESIALAFTTGCQLGCEAAKRGEELDIEKLRNTIEKLRNTLDVD